MKVVESKLAIEDSKYYYLFEEYAPFLHVRNVLRDVSRSMLACFNCGEIIPCNAEENIQYKVKGNNKTPFHICNVVDEEFNMYELGEVEYTNWLNIYVLMVENQIFRNLMTTLALKYNAQENEK